MEDKNKNESPSTAATVDGENETSLSSKEKASEYRILYYCDPSEQFVDHEAVKNEIVKALVNNGVSEFLVETDYQPTEEIDPYFKFLQDEGLLNDSGVYLALLRIF